MRIVSAGHRAFVASHTKPQARLRWSGRQGLGSCDNTRGDFVSMAPAAAWEEHDVSTPRPSAASPLRRRVSMEEDYFYQEVMTIPTHRRLSSPPEYSPPLFGYDKEGDLVVIAAEEPLPQYTCDVQLEGVFNMKMEIVDTIKRAPARNWRAMFVQLEGTKLSIYSIKKDWGLSRSSRTGAEVFADNPPWIQKGTLEKTYTLLHADVGIAADYEKRRYVIRVRAETDQFLLSCIELETFVRWLDALFAAINIAPAIDERDFPRDQSIPRGARLQYFRGGATAMSGGLTRQNSRASDVPRPAPVIHHSAVTPRVPIRQTSQRGPRQSQTNANSSPSAAGEASRGASGVPSTSIPNFSRPSTRSFAPHIPAQPGPSSEPLPSRLSTTSYPNESLNPETGKWRPRHEWTAAHDMVYAKLCYAVLLFRSPRKSNYVIAKGKKWFVDWTTGRMIRVLPPGYFDHEVVGPWQVWRSENVRI
ncbi:ph domain-containing protein [Seiridium cupressi]